MANCVKCGAQLAPGAVFCGKCGVNQTSAAAPAAGFGLGEKELLRLNMVGHNTALTQVTGTLIITDKKIEFRPLGLYVFSKPVLIPMGDIVSVGSAKILGMEVAIRVIDVRNRSYEFNVGVQNIGRVKQIVDTIRSGKR
jgi:hypothetical protein